MPTTFRFDPDRVAHFEAAGWRAYYDRRWLALLGLIVRLCQQQFHIPFPISLFAAYWVTRAAKAWAPVDHDLAAAQRCYQQFYRIARRHSGLGFDPAVVGALELESKRRQGGKAKTPTVGLEPTTTRLRALRSAD